MKSICREWNVANRLPPGWLDQAVTSNLGRPVVYLAHIDAVDHQQATRQIPPAERERAARFRVADDRRRFLVGRTALRSLLGDHLGLAPQDLAFTFGPAGKPHLADAPLPGFNLAHAGDWILLALHPRAQVGVDLERVRPDSELLPIAERFFKPDLVEQIRHSTPELRAPLFFHAWTRLEATQKAKGVGFASCDNPWDHDPIAHCIILTVPEGYHAACAWI
jgi:4'-phosphopantetheinyl transferase